MTDPLDAHLVAAIAVLAEHHDRGVTDSRDGVTVAATGIGSPAFNTAWVTAPPADPAGTLAWARDRLATVSPRYCLHVPAPFAGSIAGSPAGFAHSGSQPGMVRATTGDVPPLPPGLDVRPVTDPAGLLAFGRAMAIGFGAPDPGTRSGVLVPSMLADERLALFAGYADGGSEPCATSIAVVAEGIAGVYAVTTHDAFRRRGFGTALTWAAVAYGAQRGVPTAALQATPPGEPVYRAMGFATVRTYERYDGC